MSDIYFMYVDESGDPGDHNPADLTRSGSRHYIVSGVIIPADNWSKNLKILASLRSKLKGDYSFPIRKELHGAQIINPRNDKIYSGLGGRRTRTKLYYDCLEYYSSQMTDMEIINVHLDKTKTFSVKSLAGYDVQDLVWTRLLERYQTFLNIKKAQGIIFADDTNEDKVRKLVRKMRRYHYVGSMYGTSSLRTTTTQIIEDPIMRSSQQSYFIQIADMTSHSLYRKLYPKPSYSKYNIERLFDLLDTNLVKAAHRGCPHGQGIVRV